jgi:nucleotide-binding universal stress UspA family protein
LNTAEQDDADFLLMGWRGQQRRRRELVLGSNVDEVVAQAPCDVLVERISPVEDVESILLPTAGGPHSEFAVEVAGAIARTNDARVDAVRVIEPNPTDEERADAQERLDATFGAIETEDIGIEHRLVEGEEIAEAIISESAEYDLTIIGATREGLLQQFVFGGIPEEVGRRAENTVIMAKRNLGISSSLSRLLGRSNR